MKRPIRTAPAISAEAAAVIRQPSPAQERLLVLAWKETLADLTPGLAHDFNNTLTGILALSELFLGQIDSSHAAHESLSLIKQKAQQASQLIHCLTRLHHDKTGSRCYYDLNSMGKEVIDILSKILSRRVELSAKFASGSVPVYVDAIELRRVLLSLSLSAVQVAGGKGRIQFQTSRHKTLPVSGRFHGQRPRLPAACLSIVNSGGSFVEAQLDSALNRLPNSREVLSTLDLSLLQASAFAQKSHGAISVATKPAPGTLRIWLPVADFTEAEPRPTAASRH